MLSKEAMFYLLIFASFSLARTHTQTQTIHSITLQILEATFYTWKA